MQHQLAGTTTTPGYNAAMCSNHINNNKLEQHHHLQLLDILKCSAYQHQITKWDHTCHQIHFNTVISATTSSHPTCHQVRLLLWVASALITPLHHCD
eukprot:3950555-Amphidinium_carterae.1